MYSFSGLSLNILALLPTLVNHFDDIDEASAAIAWNIAKVNHFRPSRRFVSQTYVNSLMLLLELSSSKDMHTVFLLC